MDIIGQELKEQDQEYERNKLNKILDVQGYEHPCHENINKNRDISTYKIYKTKEQEEASKTYASSSYVPYSTFDSNTASKCEKCYNYYCTPFVCKK